jgi:hypothetical protein
VGGATRSEEGVGGSLKASKTQTWWRRWLVGRLPRKAGERREDGGVRMRGPRSTIVGHPREKEDVLCPKE